MADHGRLTAEFVATTQTDSATAHQFLEANKWDLQMAIDQYFTDGGDALKAAVADASLSGAAVSGGASSAPAQSGRAPQSSSARGHVTTLQDILRRQQAEEPDDDEEGEKYYAGGEKSATMMQGSGRDSGDGPGSLINRILKKAAQTASGSSESAAAPAAEPMRASAFAGAGYRLGSDEVDSERLGTSLVDQTAGAPSEDPTATVVRRLVFWRNGFTIDDGTLQSYEDPANKAFLTAINNGQAPLDRLNVRPGQPVELSVERRLSEEYTPPPPPPARPFMGAGQRLGSPLPSATVVSSNINAAATIATPASTSSSESAHEPIAIDESQPTTTVQIRLADGSRLIAKLNRTHTVGDIRHYISNARPDITRPYTLQTTFPPQPLQDDNVTLEEANLLNAVVVLRYV